MLDMGISDRTCDDCSGVALEAHPQAVHVSFFATFFI